MIDSTADVLPKTASSPPAGRRRSRRRAVVAFVGVACVLFLVGATSIAESPLDWADFLKALGILVFVASTTLLAFGIVQRDLRA